MVTPQAGQIGGRSSSSLSPWSFFTALDGIAERSPVEVLTPPLFSLSEWNGVPAIRLR